MKKFILLILAGFGLHSLVAMDEVPQGPQDVFDVRARVGNSLVTAQGVPLEELPLAELTNNRPKVIDMSDYARLESLAQKTGFSGKFLLQSEDEPDFLMCVAKNGKCNTRKLLPMELAALASGNHGAVHLKYIPAGKYRATKDIIYPPISSLISKESEMVEVEKSFPLPPKDKEELDAPVKNGKWWENDNNAPQPPKDKEEFEAPAFIGESAAEIEKERQQQLNCSLLKAACGGNFDEVKKAIKAGAKVNIASVGLINKTPLIWASQYGYEEIVKYLIKKGAKSSINHRSYCDMSALLCAAQGGHDRICGRLLAAGAAVNVQDDAGNTPLICALGDTWTISMPNRVATCKLLVENGADTLLVNKKGETALSIAQKKGYKDIADILKQSHSTQLIEAAKQGDQNKVNVLIAQSAAVNFKGTNDTTALHEAAVRGDAALCQILLNNGANHVLEDGQKRVPLAVAQGAAKVLLQARCDAMLIDAAITGAKDKVKSLIDAGASAKAEDAGKRTALSWAAFNGFDQVCSVLVDAGANINHQNIIGETALNQAAYRGNQDVCKLLIKKGANTELCDKWNKTPLYWAQAKGHAGIVKLLEQHDKNQLIVAIQKGDQAGVKSLIDKGADVNCPDKHGCYPLHEAVKCAHVGVCEMLLANGADITVQNGQKKTPLALASELPNVQVRTVLQDHADAQLRDAACNGDKGKVKSLIAAKAKVDAVNSSTKNTPLILAAGKGHADVCKSLLKRKATVGHQNDTKATALSLAAIGGFDKVCDVLLENGANVDHQDANGSTPLAYAAVKGHEKVCRLLVAQGANSELHDKWNGNALTHALAKGHTAIFKLLSHGKKACPSCKCYWKNTGANKMVCQNKKGGYAGCGVEWCWECVKPWSVLCNHHEYTQPVVTFVKDQFLSPRKWLLTGTEVARQIAIAKAFGGLEGLLFNAHQSLTKLKPAPMGRGGAATQLKPIFPGDTGAITGTGTGSGAATGISATGGAVAGADTGTGTGTNGGTIEAVLSKVRFFDISHFDKHEIKKWMPDMTYAQTDYCVFDRIFADGYGSRQEIRWDDYLAKLAEFGLEIPDSVVNFLNLDVVKTISHPKYSKEWWKAVLKRGRGTWHKK